VALVSGWLVFADAVAQGAEPVTPPTPEPAKPPVLKDALGNTLRRAPTGHITNYDETKVGTYTLPDPLVLRDGQPVRDAATWWERRRPEILKLYETEIFGRVPANAPPVRWEVVATERGVLEGTAMRRHLIGHFGERPDGPMVNVMLYLPLTASGPVPVVLHVTFAGDPVLAVPPVPVPAGVPPPRRFNDVGPIAEVLAHGYAYAVVRYTEIQPDSAAGRSAGIMGLAQTPSQPAPEEWGTISAWAWGLSRVMDYLAGEPTVDAKRVALVGHSRLGKTVLWAGAQDQRFALVYSSQGGEMGSALARRDYGETVDDMAAGFGYQFAARGIPGGGGGGPRLAPARAAGSRHNGDAGARPAFGHRRARFSGARRSARRHGARLESLFGIRRPASPAGANGPVGDSDPASSVNWRKDYFTPGAVGESAATLLAGFR